MPLPTYLMSNFPSVRPSLNLQFDSQPTPEDMTSHLASVGATFSRASIGTYVDANGLIQEATAGQARPNYSSAGVHEGLLIEESRTNIAKSSEDFSTTDWFLGNVTETVNQAISPSGDASADAIIEDVNTSTDKRVYQSFSGTANESYSFSVYVKKIPSGSTRHIFWMCQRSGDIIYAHFNMTTFEVNEVSESGNASGATASIESVGNDWYRIKLSGVVSNQSATYYNQLYFEDTVRTGNVAQQYNGDGESGFYLWGWQLEAGSFPTSYIPTIPTFTSRASDGTYFDSSGVLQTASTDVARTDHKYIDGQWVEAGLLLEGASTNKIEYSEDWTSGSWSATGGGGVTQSGTIAGIDSWEITSNGAIWNGANSPGQALTSGTDYAVSIFAKEGTSGKVSIRTRALVTGVETAVDYNFSTDTLTTTSELAGTVESLTREFIGSDSIRLTMVINASYSEGYYFRTTANSSTIGESVFATALQVEEGSQSTSYIATDVSEVTRSADVYTTATKQRSADVCYIDGTAFTDFYNQEEGTVLTQFESTASIIDPFLFMISDGTGSNRIAIDINDGTEFRARITADGSTNMNETFSYSDAEYKLAFGFSTSGSVVIDGTERMSDGSTTLPTVDRIHLNSQLASNILTSTIKKFIYFPRKLQLTELQKLTQ